VKKILLTLFVISLAISACAAQESSEALIGAWKLSSYGPADAQTPAVPDTEAGLTFNSDGTVSGSSGCNGLGGDYTVDGDQITFGEFVSTLIACEDPIMVQEDAMHQVLNGTATYMIEGNTLTLTNNDMVLILTR
jgi:heat shock protein HslJ